MNFEEQILEAAKSIATATGALVKAASVAQRELVEQGKVSTAYIRMRFVQVSQHWWSVVHHVPLCNSWQILISLFTV